MALKEMDRRQFLQTSLSIGASLAVGGALGACGGGGGNGGGPYDSLQGLGAIDAHAHPDQFYSLNPGAIDSTSTLAAITDSAMCASSFAAIGDLLFLYNGVTGQDETSNTTTQLDRVLARADSDQVTLVRASADIPASRSGGTLPGAILTIEGGDALMGDVNRVNTFYAMGVRLMVLVHARNNDIGDVMSPRAGRDPGPANGGLTATGESVVARMQSLGMLVDLAHASRETVRDVVALSTKPVIDSHTSPHYPSDPNIWKRLRPWDEMEWIASTGGVVCTWPIAYNAGGAVRQTFDDWAIEIMDMKNHLGMANVGLGTDGGGVLPTYITGYNSISDLSHLAEAMLRAGLSEDDIRAYFGGNIKRVLSQAIG